MGEQNSLVADFSRFCVVHDTRTVWRSNQRLERLMRSLVQAAPETMGDRWARYFLLTATASELSHTLSTIQDGVLAQADDRCLQEFIENSSQLSGNLLTAHLQNPCLFAAKWVYTTRVVPSCLGDRFSLEECMQITLEQVSNPARLLHNFNFERTNTIRTYAEEALKGILLETVRKQDNRYLRFSNWGLLRYCTKRDLQSALNEAGFSLEQVKQYCLLWYCYNEIYQVRQEGQKSLLSPAEKDVRKISGRYNQRRQEFGLETWLSWSMVSELLIKCAQALRTYYKAEIVTFQPLEKVDQPTESLLDRLLNDEEREEARSLYQSLHQSILSVIRRVYAQLGAAQNVLLLELGLEFTQTCIVELLGAQIDCPKQYKLSRYIRHCKRQFLDELVQELDERYSHLFSSDTSSDAVIDQINQVLCEQLTQHCKDELYRRLDELQQQTSELFNLCDLFTRSIEVTMSIDLSACKSAGGIVAQFIESWLEKQVTSDS